MENTRFIKIIKSFTPDEFKEFSKFINSPFFNSNKNIIKYFAHLKKYYPAFSPRYLDKKFIFKKLYGNNKFNEKKIRELSHEALKLCENYLTYLGFQRENFNQNINFLKELNNRNLPEIFEHYYKITYDNLQNKQLGYDSYHDNNTLDKELLRFYNTYSLEKAKDKMQSAIDNAVKSSIFELLRCFIGSISAMNVFGIRYDLKLEKEIIRILEKNNFFDAPLLEIYYYMMKISKGKDEMSFMKVLDIKEKNDYIFNDDIKREIYLTLHNYLYLYKSGLRNDIKNEKKKALLRDILDKGLIKDSNGFIIPNSFFNYIEILISSNMYEEATNFLKENENKLISKNKNDYANYLNGIIYMKQAHFNKSLDFFVKIGSIDKELYAMTKLQEIICYYELGYIKNLEKKIDSIQHFINRNLSNIQPEVIYMAEPFLKYFKEINPFKKPYIKIDELKNNITNKRDFYFKKWILSKINENMCHVRQHDTTEKGYN